MSLKLFRKTWARIPVKSKASFFPEKDFKFFKRSNKYLTLFRHKWNTKLKDYNKQIMKVLRIIKLCLIHICRNVLAVIERAKSDPDIRLLTLRLVKVMTYLRWAQKLDSYYHRRGSRLSVNFQYINKCRICLRAKVIREERARAECQKGWVHECR